MIRELLVATATVTAALGAATAANAEPTHYSTDVPGINYDAHLAGPCFSTDLFTFGRGPDGEALQCRFIPNQPQPNQRPAGYWVTSYPLDGVREIGAKCPRPESAAQAPDGRPLSCLGAQGWQPGTLIRYGFGFS